MQDARDAFRALKATPAVSIVALLSLALGIGANTAIFSIVDSLLLRTLPVKAPQDLALVRLGNSNQSWTNPIWESIRDRAELFDGAFAWSSTRFDLAQGGESDLVDGVWASGGYFDVLGVPAILGRTFTRADDRRGGGPDGPVAVISYSFWQNRFGGAADVIGRSVTVSRVPYTVVGVTPPGFFGTDVGRSYDVAIPLGTEPLVRGNESALDRRSSWWLRIMLRLRPDQSLEAAAAALHGVQPQIREATMPSDLRERDKDAYLKEGLTLHPAATGTSFLRSRYQQPLLTIMAVVGLVLLIACANIANLLLARGTARRHELSVRLALGASRLRLARQLLAESLLLALGGAALGLLVALWGSRLLVRQLSQGFVPVFLDLTLDWRVLGFTVAVAVTTAVLFGTQPALRATRVEPNEALKERGRGAAGEGRFGFGNVLVVLQVALSLLLVVGAGLFVRTFATLANLDLGFESRQLLVVNVSAQRLELDPPLRPEFFERLRLAAARPAGVAGVAASVVTPVSGSTWQVAIEAVDGQPLPDDYRSRGVHLNIISPDFFRTYGTDLIAGRDFTRGDGATAPRVIIVNEAFARKFIAGANPIGHGIRQMGFPGRPVVGREIVGFVKDAVYSSLREPVPPTMYIPIAQHEEPGSYVILTVRAAVDRPAMLAKSIAAALTEVSRDISLTFRPLGSQVDASLAQERLVAMLSGFFGGLALLLAALGLYGVTAYAVSRRRAEIGIRMALGAEPGGVVRLVLRRVALLVAAGVALGAAVSLWAGPLVSALLYDVPPRDPLTLAGAAIVLGAIGAMAGWIPARRASRIDPARVLREG